MDEKNTESTETSASYHPKLLPIMQNRVKICKSFWSPLHKTWKSYRQTYMVDKTRATPVIQKGNEDGHSDQIFQVAYSFSTVESIKSSIFDQMPAWISSPRKQTNANPAYGQTIVAVPKALDSVWDNHELSELTDQFVDDFVSTGLAFWKILAHDNTQMIKQIKPALKIGPITVRKEREVEVRGPENVELVYSIPNPYRTYISPDSKSLLRWQDIPYIVEEFIEQIDVAREMLGDPTAEATGSVSYGTNDKDKSVQNALKDEKRIQFWEYWGYLPSECLPTDGDPNKRYYVLFTAKKVYRCEPISFNDGEPPYELLSNYTGGPTNELGAIVPFGDIKPIYHLEEEISETRAASVMRRKRHARSKILIVGEAELDEDQLKSPEMDAIVRVEDGNSVSFLEPSNQDGGLIEHADQVRQDIGIVSGQSDIAKGADTETTVQTATGQRLQEAARSRRIKRKYRQIALVMERVGLKTLNRLAQYKPVVWVESVVDPATGEVVDTEIDLRNITDPITGLVNLNLKIRLGSQSSMEKEIVREQRRVLYGDLIQDNPMIDPNFKTEMLKGILRDYDLPEADNLSMIPVVLPANDKGGPGGGVTPPTEPQANALPGVPGMDASGKVREA